MADSETARAAPETADTTDPLIAKLLDFEPVQRRHKRPDGWTPALQRIFIAKLAELGSVNAATEALGKNRYGVEKLYKSAGAKSFRKAWDAAIALYEEREAKRLMIENAPFAGVKPPFADPKGRFLASTAGPLPGQVMNEHGEWEDEASFIRRGEEAVDSVREKLLRCRRLYLMEISGSAGKRAAFEILTELPIDWDKAKRLEPQPDEPWHRANQRQPDMILTAENGWSFGECGYGEDKKAELRRAMDEHRAEMGLEPVDWSESAEPKALDGEADEATSARDAYPVRPTTGAAVSIDGANSLRAGTASSSQDRSGPRLRRV
jgi:hypothetical protein